tara:strand:- start:3394 stop:4155 length:762 start_codon:yes stop_codon:yes gene_type:complete
MMMNDKKIIWITGGGSGIGSELAKIFANNGHKVIISGRDKIKLIKVSNIEPDLIKPFKIDISSEQECKNVINQIYNKMDMIDIVILNAAAYNPGHIDFNDMKKIKTVVDTNLIGQMNCLKFILPRMKEKKSGHIVFVSSPAGFRGLPNAGIYGVTKSALTFLSESLYIELKKFDIKVQVIHPGFVKTPMTDKNNFPMPFLISAEEAAKRINKKLWTNDFEIFFPKRFIYIMKLLQLLPNKIYLFLMTKILSKI